MATTTPPQEKEPELVILDWKDIAFDEENHDGTASATTTSPRVLEALEQALGPNGMGLVAICNVPGFVAAKQALLPQAYNLVNHLPADYLEGPEMTDPASLYNAGWSHGKEKLGDGKTPDLAKGSFYYNPLTDLPGSEEDRAKYPLSYPPNKWPSENLMPKFKQNATTLGRLLKDVVVTLCKHVDALTSRNVPSYPPDFLYKTMKDTEKAKARLLYYFPLEETSNASTSSTSANAEDSWTGWHLDSGFLTALAGDLYINHKTGEILPQPPDPKSGLYILDRQNTVRQVHIPADCLAVQIGECTQIVTGGAVVATPHCVRGASSSTTTTSAAASSQVARISLPCFIDTPPTFALSVPPGCTRQDALDASATTDRVPPLGKRWTKNGMTFGDFLHDTFAMYYDWNSAGGASGGDGDDATKSEASYK